MYCVEFHCVPDCSECCVKREYYPEKRFGKIGVLILPEERDSIMQNASRLGLKIRILPRIGVSKHDHNNNNTEPTKILAYQMMGRDDNGDTCPFLDTTSGYVAPHGGLPCKIYDKRPLACAAYPLAGHNPITLDQKCKFCKEHCNADDINSTVTSFENMDSEVRALIKIEKSVQSSDLVIWRYATATGDQKDSKHFAKPGWIRVQS